MEAEQHQLQKDYGTATDNWTKLKQKRTSLESVWKDCSKLTLPYVFPEENTTEDTYYPTPYNSIGSSGVNALASKLLLALLPPTSTFFRLLPFDDIMKGATAEQEIALDKELSKIEGDIIQAIDTQGLRVNLFEALKMLVVTGNTMLFKVPGKGFKVYSPYQYVVQRDFVGNLVKIITKEKVSKSVLPKEIVDALPAEEGPKKDVNKDEVDIYTTVIRQNLNKFISYQEANGIVIESTIENHNEDILPDIPLRWTSSTDEDYGRGLVEQYLGDLRSLEGLSQVIVEGTAIMSKVIFGKKPSSTTRINDLTDALNGEFVVGDLEKDISVLRVDKNSDFSIPLQLQQVLESRLSKAFLNLEIRQSERTTATEVRATQNELNAVLGGTFSVLANDFQLPTIKILLDEIEPKTKKIADPAIVAGISSISREKDLQDLTVMAQAISQFGPEAVNKYMDLQGYFTQYATSLGIDPDKVVRSKDEVQQIEQAEQQAMQAEQQQQQMQQMQQG